MIDIERETLISLTEAAKLIPGRPSTTTVWRWRNRGIGGRKLESVAIGKRIFTSREAVARFARQHGGEPTQSRTPARRRKAIEAAERELDALGV